MALLRCTNIGFLFTSYNAFNFQIENLFVNPLFFSFFFFVSLREGEQKYLCEQKTDGYVGGTVSKKISWWNICIAVLPCFNNHAPPLEHGGTVNRCITVVIVLNMGWRRMF